MIPEADDMPVDSENQEEVEQKFNSPVATEVDVNVKSDKPQKEDPVKEELSGLASFSVKLDALNNEDTSFPIDVCFKNLNYTAQIPRYNPGTKTVATELYRLATAIPRALVNCNNTLESRVILDNMSGVFKAGVTTLVLGPPGCGVSTLFKALSDTIIPSKSTKLSGKVTYSGYTKKQLVVRKFSSRVDQIDVHIPTLTVTETLQFAFSCLGGLKRIYGSKIPKLFGEEKGNKYVAMVNDLVQFVVSNFGLTNCKDTIVGNELLRGVSGGEKRRVTTTEAFIGLKPFVLFDQLSTGLDSAATFDICKDLTSTARNRKCTYVFSLLQPDPEVYKLFDEILVMAEGMILFHGKRSDVLPFFQSIGYNCPEHKDIADFIQEVTTDMRAKYFSTETNCDFKGCPTNNKQIAEAWLVSDFAVAKAQEVAACKTAPKTFNKMTQAFTVGSSKYNNGFLSEFNLVFRRQWKLYYRNKMYLRARFMQIIIMGLLIGVCFLDLSPQLIVGTSRLGISNRYSILFFVVLQASLGGMSILPTVFANRGVFYKQTRSFFYRPFAYALSSIVVPVPWQMLEAFILMGLTFFLVELVPYDSPDIIRTFFGLVCFLFVSNAAMTGYLRAVASVCPNSQTASVIAGVSIATCVLFSGFIITADNIPIYFLWLHWLTPFAYALRALILITFNDSAFSDFERQEALDMFSFDYGTDYVYYSLAYFAISIVLNVFLIALALSFCRYEGSGKRRVVQPHNEEANDPKTQLMRVSSSGVRKVLQGTGFTPITVTFNNLWYTVPTKKGESLDLLKGISGYAKPGYMTALMGASGAGKTTLMDVIAGRKTGGTIKGEILINGKPKRRAFAGQMGYVEQMDVHCPRQTVAEAVYFSGYLRQKGERKDIDRFVETVIDTVELNDIRDFEVGFKDQGGLTVEQAKRLTIAVELAANPSVLFCDEPTSGLDSRAAEVIMRGISKVARSGRTVVCTIHQPNRSIFEWFDRVLLLQRGGKTVYFGDLGEHSSKLVTYLENIPGTPKIRDKRYNPATYMLEVIGAGTSTTSGTNSAKAVDFSEFYSKSELRTTNEVEIKELSEPSMYAKIGTEGEDNQDVDLGYAVSMWTQQELLIKRTFLSYWRNPSYNVIRHLVVLVMALLWGTTYFQAAVIDPEEEFTESLVISIMGILFNSSMFIGVINMNLAMPHIVAERGPFYREKASRMYSGFPYGVAWTLVEIPYVCTSLLLFLSVFYFMAGFVPAATLFFSYWGVFLLYILCVVWFAQMLVVLLPNEATAMILVALTLSFWSFFSGFFIAPEDIVPALSWITTLSPIKYALNAFSALMFSCGCDVNEIEGGLCPQESIGCNVLSFETADGEIVKSTAWDFMQSTYGTEDNLLRDVLALICFAVGFRLVTFYGYIYVNHMKR